MDKKQITRDAPAIPFQERFKTQEYVGLAPKPAVFKAHFAMNETNKLPLKELLAINKLH